MNIFSGICGLNQQINLTILIVFFILLSLICFKLISSQNLIESIILMSILSLLSVVCYLLMDAPDVAMTEASLSASLSTCIFLNLLKTVPNTYYKVSKCKVIPALILCLILAFFFIIASSELPLDGNPDKNLQLHLTKYYFHNIKKDIGISSIVTGILASYRGYDTLAETSVILISGIAVAFILGDTKRQ